MKTTVSTKRKSTKPFPKLMLRKTDNTICLFTEESFGFRLSCGKGNTASTPYYRYSKYWNMANFEDFEGEVILSNA